MELDVSALDPIASSVTDTIAVGITEAGITTGDIMVVTGMAVMVAVGEVAAIITVDTEIMAYIGTVEVMGVMGVEPVEVVEVVEVVVELSEVEVVERAEVAVELSEVEVVALELEVVALELEMAALE